MAHPKSPCDVTLSDLMKAGYLEKGALLFTMDRDNEEGAVMADGRIRYQASDGRDAITSVDRAVEEFKNAVAPVYKPGQPAHHSVFVQHRFNATTTSLARLSKMFLSGDTAPFPLAQAFDASELDESGDTVTDQPEAPATDIPEHTEMERDTEAGALAHALADTVVGAVREPMEAGLRALFAARIKAAGGMDLREAALEQREVAANRRAADLDRREEDLAGREQVLRRLKQVFSSL